MKRLFRIAVLSLILISMFALMGCSPKEPLVIKESETCIVVKVSAEQKKITNSTTLLDYMNMLKADGKLLFETSNGMVKSINGIENPADWSKCWMLYTNDAELSNEAWGKITVNDLSVIR